MTSRRESILRASATAIAERGVRGLRVSDIAQVAGVSPGLLYYHFKDRDGLLAAALTYINDEARAYRQAAGGPGASREQLIDYVLAEIQDTPAVLENSLAWNELRACAVYEEPLREPLARTSEQWTRETAEAIRGAQAAGEVPDAVDADQVATVITALTEGLSARWLSGELSAERAREQLRATVELLIPAKGRTRTRTARS
ncbi:TetR/AcrR family transcriptional regulator [Nocardia inohanensis]|uniref:TetR/AcrR family transcriptional regulator n=1 Tax=Nocardia inohanensis TaxID=209246 RepID=UPI0008364D5E|nr:TetR/AcrR family transcriptional regulator [Nocardia inohanensis]